MGLDEILMAKESGLGFCSLGNAGHCVMKTEHQQERKILYSIRCKMYLDVTKEIKHLLV